MIQRTLAVCLLLLVSSWAVADQAPLDPRADSKAVVVSGKARFTVLTPSLVRMEWSPSAGFEDRASLVFINRRLPVPKYELQKEDGWLVVRTSELVLRYREGDGAFDGDSLSVAFRLNGREQAWRPGLEDRGNLRGTRISLDGISGAAPLGSGLLSRDGWVVLDDSAQPLLDGQGQPQPRGEEGAIDWYFFGYGHRYREALQDFVLVAGRVPLPPKFVFGSWWSRYWAYSEAELKDIVRQFDEHDIPLDVLVLDMDWHLPGWSGYSWEPKYFSDPAGFLAWAHDQRLRVTLNLHPGFDIEKHETRYADFAKALGRDPQKGGSIPFDHTDPQFAQAYFTHFIHPLEREGVDFWWLDYAGHAPKPSVEGLDVLLWCNILHYLDSQKGGGRGLMFSRWGGLANHRYQIGFSADAYSTWESLAFQPYFNATAGNVCFPYWSHDIGGHLPGPCEPELYLRWIQWGAFSPTLRTHATRNEKAERRIWAFSPDIFAAAKQAFHLRYELISYIYTAARRCYDLALPLCRPLYYDWPDLDAAYDCPGQFLFGNDLLVAPVTVPANAVSRCAQTRVWIPPGEWVHWFTGETFAGPKEVVLWTPLHEIPVFARAGAIIPAAPKMRRLTERPADPLILHVFPGGAAQAEVYEDDGASRGYEQDEYARLTVKHDAVNGRLRLRISPWQGAYVGMPTKRGYEIRWHDLPPPVAVVLDGHPVEAEAADGPAWQYDATNLTPRPADRGCELSIEPYGTAADRQVLRRGLRGRLSLLQEIEGLLGKKTPKEAVAALGCRALMLADPAAFFEEARRVVEQWPALLLACLEAEAPKEVQDRAVARLLGSAFLMRVKSGDDAVEARVTVDMASAPPFGTLEGVKGRIRLHVPEHWSVKSGDQAERTLEWTADLKDGKVSAFDAVLVPDGPPRTGIVRAEFLMAAGRREMRAELETTLLPSIGSWWVVGPFDNPWSQGLDQVFPPEEKIDLTAKYKGAGGREVAWRTAVREIKPGADLTAEFAIDGDKFYGEHFDGVVAYALTYLHAPQDMDAVLAVGSDDGVAAWLNGKEVHCVLIGRPYSSRQDRVPVRLRKGTNTLLLKICQGGGPWGFGAHIETPDGLALPEVEALLEP